MSTSFAQLVVAAQRLTELVDVSQLTKLSPEMAAEAESCKQTIIGFVNTDLLPNDEAATIGGLFAKIAAFRAAKDEDGQAVRALEIQRQEAVVAKEVAEFKLAKVVESFGADLSPTLDAIAGPDIDVK